MSYQDDTKGHSMWAHEAMRIQQSEDGRGHVGLSVSDPAERGVIWDFIVSRSGKSCMANGIVNYTVGLRVHNIMWLVYDAIRAHFVLNDNEYIPLNTQGVVGRTRKLALVADTASDAGASCHANDSSDRDANRHADAVSEARGRPSRTPGRRLRPKPARPSHGPMPWGYPRPRRRRSSTSRAPAPPIFHEGSVTHSLTQ
jgi:hypothetical protein